MLYIILSIILFIGLFGVLGYDFDAYKWKTRKRQLVSILGFIPIIFGCITIIPANNVGIRYNPFKNGTQEKTLSEGFYFKNPLEKIYKLSVKIKEFQFENISIQTKDSQFVNSVLQVQARIDVTQASEYFKKYGNNSLKDNENIIAQTIQKEFEKVTTTYNVMEFLGEKRNEIVDKTLKNVKEELLNDGIIIERIILIDTDAGDDVEQAIKNEAIAKKNAETAIYKKQQAQTEGEAKVIEAQKNKEANELINKTLSKEILMQQFIEKWNGQLPTNYAGDDILSIFNLN